MKVKQINNRELFIMLADDGPDDRLFFKEALKVLQIATRLITVENGEELMDFLLKNSEQLPDVLFLDLNMPRKSGFEYLSEIKHDKKIQHIPIIIYSTLWNEEIGDMVFRNGAHYFLKKCNFIKLSKSIQKVLDSLAENSNQPSRDKFLIQ